MRQIVLASLDGDLIDSINSEKTFELIGVFDFANTVQRKSIRIIGEDGDWRGWHKLHPAVKSIIAVDSPKSRRKLVSIYGDENTEGFFSVHAYVSQGAVVDHGVILQRNVYVSEGVRIGEYSKLNVGVSVHHDCTIGKFVTLAPGVRLLGNVCIENDAYIGAGAIVLPGLVVRSGAVVGAGAVVTKSVGANDVVVGVPAAILTK